MPAVMAGAVPWACTFVLLEFTCARILAGLVFHLRGVRGTILGMCMGGAS